jgi:hypothetical protein
MVTSLRLFAVIIIPYRTDTRGYVYIQKIETISLRVFKLENTNVAW